MEPVKCQPPKRDINRKPISPKQRKEDEDFYKRIGTFLTMEDLERAKVPEEADSKRRRRTSTAATAAAVSACI